MTTRVTSCSRVTRKSSDNTIWRQLYTIQQMSHTHYKYSTITVEQSFLHAHCPNVSLTPFWTGTVPDRQSPGWFPMSPGITGLQLSLPADRCALTGRSRNADIAQTGSYRHPRSHPTTSDLRRPDTPERPSLRSLTIAYLQNCPGFHRTAVIMVRAFTVPLLYHPGFHRTAVISSGLSQCCCSTSNRTIHHQGSTWTSLTIH